MYELDNHCITVLENWIEREKMLNKCLVTGPIYSTFSFSIRKTSWIAFTCPSFYDP